MLDFVPSTPHENGIDPVREGFDPLPSAVMPSERPDSCREFTSVAIPGLVSPAQPQQSESKAVRRARSVDALMRFVLTVPGGFGAIWAMFAATDTVLGILLPDSPRLSADGLFVLVAFACSLLGGLGGFVSWTFNEEQARQQEAVRRALA